MSDVQREVPAPEAAAGHLDDSGVGHACLDALDDSVTRTTDTAGTLSGSGDYALHGGAERLVVGNGPDYLRLQLPREELDTYDAPGVLDRREEPSPLGGSVKVTKASVQRLVRRTVQGRWRGGRATVLSDGGDRLFIDFVGPPDVAEAYGLAGDRRDGWHGPVPREEVTDIVETERELPVVIREPRR